MKKSEQLFTELANIKQMASQALQQVCSDILFKHNRKLRLEGEEENNDPDAVIKLQRQISISSHDDANLNESISSIRVDGLMCQVRSEGEDYDQKVEELDTEVIIGIIQELERNTNPEIF